MKKLFTLIAVSLACIMTANAVDLGIRIGNTQITTTNFANVTDEKLLSGTISYDPSTYVLTLNNVNLEDNIYVEACEADLTINFIGDNFVGGFLTNQVTDPINVTWTGDTLRLYLAWILFDNNLIIKDAKYVSIDDTEDNVLNAIALLGSSSDTLTIDNSELHVYSNSENGAIADFGKIELKNCAIAAAGAGIDSGAVKGFDGTRLQTVDILPATFYGINMVGASLGAYNNIVEVNSVNCSNLIFPGTEGTASFDPSTYTLTLNRLPLFGLTNEDCEQDLTINCNGQSGLFVGVFGSTKTPIMTTITGDTLSALGIELTGNGNTLRFKNTTALIGEDQLAALALSGDGTNTNLIIDNSMIHASTNPNATDDVIAAVNNFGSITLIDAVITSPEEAQVVGGAIRNADGTYSQDVVIMPTRAAVENVTKSDINIYPNPAMDEVVLHMDNAEGAANVTIYSTDGRVVMNSNFNADTDCHLNVSALAAGTYVVKVTTETASHTSTLIKK